MITRRTLVTASSLAPALSPRWSRADEAPEAVRFVVNAVSFVVAMLKIGDQAGIFARHGLSTSLVVMDSGAAALSALIGGSAPFSVNAPSETLNARLHGQDVVIVANLYAGMAASLLLGTAAARRLGVAADAPLENRLRALDGQVIAVPSATSAPLGPIKAAVERTGAKLRLAYMAQGAMPAALETGAIQGMIAAYPFVATPLLRGTGLMWINGPAGDLPEDLRLSSSATVQTTPAFVASNQATVRRLQQAVAAVGEFISGDRDAARQALARSYPQMSAAEIDLAFTQQWRNWTRPFLTEAELRQDLRLQVEATRAPGLDRLDPSAALVGPQ